MTIHCGFCLTVQHTNCRFWVPGIAGEMLIASPGTATMGKHTKRLIIFGRLKESSSDEYMCTTMLNHLLIQTIAYFRNIILT